MDLNLLLSFLSAAMLLSLMPGPDNLFVLTQSLTKGRHIGIAITTGLCLGILIHTSAASIGLSLFLQKYRLAFLLMKYLGVGYFLYLAHQTYKEKPRTISIAKSINNKNDDHLKQYYKKGFLMNVLNPKVSLFFIAFLPQFVTKNGMNITLQMLLLGLLFMLQAFVLFSGIAILSSRLTKYLNRPSFWRVTRWLNISVLLILGILLALP